MEMAPIDDPIIDTGTLKRLRFVADTIARTAGIGIVRGPVGIGKTFALERIHAILAAEGVRVVRVTARPEYEGSMRDFLNAILATWGLHETSVQRAIDTLLPQIMGTPLSAWSPQRSIVMVDEAQNLKVNNLELLRGIWDRGDPARVWDREALAFGLMLVGNSSFLNRQGRAREADYKPLMSRVDIYQELHGPSEDECFTLANMLCRSDKAGAARLAEHGIRRNELRAIARKYRQAKNLAGDEPVSLKHIEAVLKLLGVKR
jgi:DNA transposition AAA+ family ATPase